MESNVQHVRPGTILQIEDGDHFSVLLPDGSQLHFGQSRDEFAMLNSLGMVIYSRPTSPQTKQSPFRFISYLDN